MALAVSILTLAAAIPMLLRLRDVGYAPEELRVPRAIAAGDYDNHLVFYAGRAAGDGEAREFSGSAFAPGEPLHCTGIERLSPTDAEAAIERLGYEVVWPPRAPGEGSPDRRPAGKVTGAALTDAHANGDGTEQAAANAIVVGTSSTKLYTPPPTPAQDCGQASSSSR